MQRLKLRKNLVKLTSAVSFGVFSFLAFTGEVVLAADTVGDFLPRYIPRPDPDNPGSFVDRKVTIGLALFFIAVLIFGLIYAAIAAAKYMASGGDQAKQDEAKGAAKAVLIGYLIFAGCVIAIVGIFVFLGSESSPLEEPVSFESLFE